MLPAVFPAVQAQTRGRQRRTEGRKGKIPVRGTAIVAVLRPQGTAFLKKKHIVTEGMRRVDLFIHAAAPQPARVWVVRSLDGSPQRLDSVQGGATPSRLCSKSSWTTSVRSASEAGRPTYQSQAPRGFQHVHPDTVLILRQDRRAVQYRRPHCGNETALAVAAPIPSATREMRI